jgi:hypothetical protein
LAQLPRSWDGGKPVSARGRFWVQCPIGVVTPLTEAGGVGTIGDELDWVWFFPADLTPGPAHILDGATPLWSWPGGITLNDTRPIFVPLNLRSATGPWSISLPGDMSALAAGAFS